MKFTEISNPLCISFFTSQRRSRGFYYSFTSFYLQAKEKEWEEKRQNMGHYDGKEFEKILQEAQANMMKGIPNIGVEENQILPSAGIVEQGNIPSPVESPSGTNQTLCNHKKFT